MEIYLIAALIIWPFASGLLIRHWWIEFDKPLPIAFDGVVWGIFGGLLFAIVWPLSFIALTIWACFNARSILRGWK